MIYNILQIMIFDGAPISILNNLDKCEFAMNTTEIS